MKKLFGFANKTLDNFRPFPEFTAMDTALTQGTNSAIKYNHHWNEGTGHLFSEFANHQPTAVCESLTEVQKCLNERYTILQSNNEAYKSLKAGIQPLQVLNQGIRDKRKHLKDLNTNLEKCTNSAHTLQNKYDKARLKNPSSMETSKLKSELQMAEQKKEIAGKELDTYTKTFEEQNKVYKKELFSTMLKALLEFSNKFVETCEAQLPVADAMIKQGGVIPDYSDNGIQQIREELDSLKAATAEPTT